MSSASSYTPREELINALTHGLGVVLSVAGLVLMVVDSVLHGDAWQVTSSAIFGVSLIALYTTSTLYHSFRSVEMKHLLRKFDHAAIFLLIAGSYTPFLLVTLRGAWGWSLFGVVWGLAAVGVGLKFWFAGRFRLTSTLIYLGMGWLVIVAVKPMLLALPPGGGDLVGGWWRVLFFRHGLLPRQTFALSPRDLAPIRVGRQWLPLDRSVLLCASPFVSRMGGAAVNWQRVQYCFYR